MYGKLNEGNLMIAPRKLEDTGVVVYNPPAEMYLEHGWKPVEFTDAPEAPEGFYYESGWEETADSIVQTWTLVELPPEELSAEEALTRYTNELTNGNAETLQEATEILIKTVKGG